MTIIKRASLLFMATAVLAGSGFAVVIWDTGAPHTVIFNGTEVYLGYSSGNISGAPQRWAAIPFRISNAGTIIQQVNVDWFIVAGSEAATVEYIIWRRTALNAPVDGDQVAMGTLGAFGAGIDDPRVPGTEDWLHQYAVNIPLAVGDYYFTIYGAGIGTGNTSGFSNVPWLTGGDLQDEALEQAFMWRSVSFPAPGFVMYAPAAIQPTAGQDPDDRWNPSFSLEDRAVKVLPSSFSLFRGVLVAGDVTSLHSPDDNRLIARPGVVLNQAERPIQVIVNGTANPATASSMTVRVESHCNIANIRQWVEAFNWTSSTYTELDMRIAPTSDMRLELSVPTPGDHINSSGELRVRVSYKEAGPIFSYPWFARIDEATWLVAP